MADARNVLLIIADQWRGDSLGSVGHPACITPNLDALAADGVTFRRHYGQSAPCGPARASMLTGLYVMNHRVVANGVPLDATLPTLATEALRAGIDPVLVGYTTTTPDPRTTGPGDPRFREIGDVMDGFRIFAHFDEVDFRTYFGWAEGLGMVLPADPQDAWRPTEGPLGPTARPSQVPAQASDTAWSGRHALDFLRTTRPDRPWLLHLGFFRPHPPFAAPAPYNDIVTADRIPPRLRAATPEAEAAQHPALAHFLRNQPCASYFQGATGRVAALDDAAITQTRQTYYGLIAEIDVWVGQVIAELKRSGAYDRTLIIFTSDHGEQLGDHHLLGKLGWFDQSYHLPLIIRDPDQPATRGTSVDAFSEGVDLMPTILDWYSAECPPCDGASLRPFLAGATPASWRSEVAFEYDLRGGYPAPKTLPDALRGAGPLAVLRSATWKYVHLPGLDPVLYDLVADPFELVNIAADPTRIGLLAHAAGRMLDWRIRHESRGLTGICATPEGLVSRLV
jgi:arylsulfatase A-like enzyme